MEDKQKFDKQTEVTVVEYADDEEVFFTPDAGGSSSFGSIVLS